MYSSYTSRCFTIYTYKEYIYTLHLIDLIIRNDVLIFSLVRMAVPKAVGCMIVILVVYYGLENQGYRQSLNVFFEVRIIIK